MTKVFAALVDVDEGGIPTRRRSFRDEIGADDFLDRLLDDLIDKRLLTSGDAGGRETIEVAHEKLFAAWPQLCDWIAANSEQLVLRAEVGAEMARWRRSNCDDEFLLRKRRLTLALALMYERPELLDDAAREFIIASENHERKENIEAQDRQRREAYRLAKLARDQIASANPDMGILLALEGLSSGALSSETWHPELVFAMWEALLLKKLAPPGQFTLRGHEGRVYSGEFSPDGRKAVTASEDETARLWDVQTGMQIHVFGLNPKNGYGWPARFAAFSPDSTKVITIFDDGTVRGWEIVSGEKCIDVHSHLDVQVLSAALSRDGTKVITVFDNGTTRLLDIASGDELILARRNHFRRVISATFSEDGTQVVTCCDSTVRIIHIASGKDFVAFDADEASNFVPLDAAWMVQRLLPFPTKVLFAYATSPFVAMLSLYTLRGCAQQPSPRTAGG